MGSANEGPDWVSYAIIVGIVLLIGVPLVWSLL